MDKAAIKNFAIWARNKLIADISYKAGLLGITEKEIKKPLSQSTSTVQFFDIGTKNPSSITGYEIKQRRRLVEEIQRKADHSDYGKAYNHVVEEVAYTWFNRLIAIRFMEVNDYLPTGVRVLSSEQSGKIEPDLVTYALDVDLNYSSKDKEQIIQLKHENKLDELFRMLFIKQCNELNANLPELFEKTNDHSELLLNVSFTDKDGVISRLVNDIPEDDFNVSKKGQVEIIGWLYQYYNEERKNEVINIYKGTIKKEDIPAATQLFTTDWVVHYMVDNSLGRYWLERNPESKLSNKLEFFVKSKKYDFNYVDEKIAVEDLTIFDPCMGSGHILVYAFDVLMEIYRESGYADIDAAQLIVEKNLFGLDIDNRAYQLAYFAVMMKARSYDNRFLSRNISPNVLPIIETNEIDEFSFEGITNDENQNEIGEYLVKAYKDAKEIGSLLSVKEKDYESFIDYLDKCDIQGQMSMESDCWFREIKPVMKNLAKQASIMSNKYNVVCTNPPYMNKLEGQLEKFVAKKYRPYRRDLFSVFMYRNFDYCQVDGYSALMTPFVWMFIKTYEKLRDYIITQKSISTLIQMQYSAFEEATVPICSFVLKNGEEREKGKYIKLSDFKGGMETQKQKVLEALSDPQCNYFYETSKDNFFEIPASPIVYWASEQVIKIFEKGIPMKEMLEARQGLASGDNARFLRLWFEVDLENINFSANSVTNFHKVGKLYAPHNKGGSYRRWYGNYDYVIKFDRENFDVLAEMGNCLPSRQFYFRDAISWSLITSAGFSIRYRKSGSVPNVAGNSAFSDDPDLLKYLLGLLSTPIADYVFKMLNPTLNLNVGDFDYFPVFVNDKQKEEVLTLAEACVKLAEVDWDSFETSWDFQKHPLIIGASIENAFNKWEIECDDRFNQLRANEEELNRIFIDIYGLQDELTSEVEDKDVTVRKSDLKRDIRNFISYAVGCMFGRYSLDIDGLVYAGGEWNENKYKIFIPDQNNILPITDEEYFSDDIVGLFIEFVKTVYGSDTLEDNLDFVAKGLGTRGNSSRDIIRNYFMRNFYKDHCQIYKKRPIYWLFDSGRQNGFKALIYMHRYDENTIGNLRIDYLHRMQGVYEDEIARMQETIENSDNAREVRTATKRKDQLIKQLQESKDYDEKIAHLALARIPIDLDDGVKVNYEKVQTDTEGNKLQVLAKI